MTTRGLSEATVDLGAVIEQLILGKLVRENARILLAGHSRGGFLSLIMAAHRPELVKGVINFAGGWHGVNDRVSPRDYEPRIEAQTTRLSAVAKKVIVPTIWIYEQGDVFYSERSRRCCGRGGTRAAKPSTSSSPRINYPTRTPFIRVPHSGRSSSTHF